MTARDLAVKLCEVEGKDWQDRRLITDVVGDLLMLPTPDAWGQTLFCDDVRQELGGKLTLVGIYTADMIFSEGFPAIMPKFVCFTTYYEKLGYSDRDLSIAIYLPQDTDVPSIKIPVLRENIAQTQQVEGAGFKEAGAEMYITLSMPIQISPLEVKQEGNIRIRVENGNDVVKVGKISLRKDAIIPPMPIFGAASIPSTPATQAPSTPPR